jgi:hypothetical protein
MHQLGIYSPAHVDKSAKQWDWIFECTRSERTQDRRNGEGGHVKHAASLLAKNARNPAAFGFVRVFPRAGSLAMQSPFSLRSPAPLHPRNSTLSGPPTPPRSAAPSTAPLHASPTGHPVRFSRHRAADGLANTSAFPHDTRSRPRVAQRLRPRAQRSASPESDYSGSSLSRCLTAVSWRGSISGLLTWLAVLLEWETVGGRLA